MSPFAAVTVISIVFSPASRASPPTTSTVAFSSVGTATTSTDSVPAGNSTVAPSSMASPFSVNSESDVSELSATFRVIV